MYSRAAESSQHEVATLEAATLCALVNFFAIVFDAIGKVSPPNQGFLACMRFF